jgi:hypothetical protein
MLPALICVFTFSPLCGVVVVCGGVRIACPPRLGLPVLSEPAAWVFSRRPRPSWSRIIHPLPGGSGCGLNSWTMIPPALMCVLIFISHPSFGCVSLCACEVSTCQTRGVSAPVHRLLSGKSSYFWQCNRQGVAAITHEWYGSIPQRPLAQGAPG